MKEIKLKLLEAIRNLAEKASKRGPCGIIVIVGISIVLTGIFFAFGTLIIQNTKLLHIATAIFFVIVFYSILVVMPFLTATAWNWAKRKIVQGEEHK